MCLRMHHLPFPVSSLPLLPDQHGACSEDSVRMYSGSMWRTSGLQDKNFCMFMYVLHDNEQVWMDYFETVVTKKGTTGARTSLPSYLRSSQSNETWIDWKHKGSLMTGSGSFWLNNSAVIVNNNNPNVIRPVPGITVTQTDFRFDSG